MSREIHPCARGWVLPPEGRPRHLGPGLERTNLRELGARPRRFEHHLTVVGQIGVVQLEAPVASEPLSFGHVNVSDEYVLPLPSGNPMLDGFPFRTFIADPDTNRDVLRLNHKTLELVLHPYGFSHWPGRQRPPYAPMAFPPDMRRAGMSLVLCANVDTPPPDPRALWVTPGREDAAKRYEDVAVPVLLASLVREPARTLCQVADVRWELLVEPTELSPTKGGYLVVLDAAADGPFFASDLVYVASGATLSTTGITRALWMVSDTTEASMPPRAWDEVHEAPFAPFEEGVRGTLPVEAAGLRVEALDADTVHVTVAGQTRRVPRYWLSRMLFRIALHDYRLGRLETYEGLFYDDRGEGYTIGLRDVGDVTLSRDEVVPLVERLYRAVAPEGYVEHLR